MITNNDYLDKLAAIVKQFKYCKKTELLSYHNLAQDKYAKLGINYPLKDIQMLSTKEFEGLKDFLLKQVNK